MIKSEVIIRKVWRSEISSIAIFIVFSVLCIIISQKIEISVFNGRLFSLGNNYDLYLRFPILWMVPFSYLMVAIYRVYNVIYKVDNRGIESTIGRLALKQRINRVRYEDIRAIDIHHTIFDRMLDVGTIAISTAASADAEVYLSGVDSPYEIKDMLERERDARLKAAK